MSALGVGETGRGAVRAKRSQMGWPSPDGSVVLRHRSWDNRKWFEIWDESTVGTFSNLGFEDDRTVKDGNLHVALEKVDTNVRVRGEGGW